MPYTTELMTFAVKPGKEARADEWMCTLVQRRAECVDSLDREAMHFESIFKSERDGRMYLSWLSVQGAGGAHVKTSPLDIDAVHMAFWHECIDRDIAPQTFEHVVDFVPPSVEAAIVEREATLAAARGGGDR